MPSVSAFQHHADAEVGRHRCGLQPRLLPRAVLEVADVLRQPAHRRHDQRPGQLGRRPPASRRPRRPRCPAACRPRRRCASRRWPVCEISLSFGSFSSSWRGNWVRSRISTSTSASRSRTDSWPMPLTVLVKTLAFRGSSTRAHLQLAHRVLVVVEDDDVHGLPILPCRRCLAGPSWKFRMGPDSYVHTCVACMLLRHAGVEPGKVELPGRQLAARRDAAQNSAANPLFEPLLGNSVSMPLCSVWRCSRQSRAGSASKTAARSSHRSAGSSA